MKVEHTYKIFGKRETFIKKHVTRGVGGWGILNT